MFKLRDYQKDIVTRGRVILDEYKILYLSMEVRTGKTLTALTLGNDYKSVLFVTKKKAISSIKSDMVAIGYNYALEVVNYESVHKVKGEYDLIILDEAHRLGAYPKKSKVLDVIKKIAHLKPIIYLSGTPTPESFSQIYHQLDASTFSPFKQWRSFYKWAHDFVNIKQMMINGFKVNVYKDANKQKIDEYCSHLFISYTQGQAGFVNTINETVLYIPMGKRIESLIQRVTKDGIVEGKDEVILAETAVKMQNKVHQLCSGTIKFESGNTMVIDTAKADFIKSHFKGEKIAIFYKFKAELDMLKSVFDNLVYDVDEFKTVENSIFCSQILSGREGINLSNADSLIFINIDFSATSYLQARDRLSSMSRTKENNVYWLFSHGGIEDKIYQTVQKKQDYTLSYFRKDYNIIK
jgi:SNF2 family DNA or RNA helicase